MGRPFHLIYELNIHICSKTGAGANLHPVISRRAFVPFALIVTLFFFWVLVLTIVWLALGHRRPYYPARYYRRTMRHAYGRWRA